MCCALRSASCEVFLRSIKEKEADVGDPSPIVTISAWVAVSLFLIIVALLTAPVTAFFGDSQLAVVSATHGLLATLGVVVGTVASYLGWRLFTGKIKAFSDLKILTAITTFIAAATVIFGNLIYIAYRAPGGPRAFFLKNNPAIHSVFFEFKEFIALFPLPLLAAATFVIWRYGDQLIENKPMRTWVGIVFALSWASFIMAYLLGAGITKLRSV